MRPRSGWPRPCGAAGNWPGSASARGGTGGQVSEKASQAVARGEVDDVDFIGEGGDELIAPDGEFGGDTVAAPPPCALRACLPKLRRR